MTPAARLVVIAYSLATLVAAAVILALPQLSSLYAVAAADVAATLVIFGFSMRYDNSSFYDPYWSVVPPLVAVYLALGPIEVGVSGLRSLLLLGGVWFWGVRLTHNWWRGWTGLDHEDWRYVDMRESSGSLYPLVSLAGIHMFPTAIVFAGMLPLWPALTSGSAALGWLDVAAVLVTYGAVLIELVSDNQLRAFRQSNPAAGAILDSGLWKYSRHPNYFGEASFWWGLFLFALAAEGTAALWTGAGALAITIMFWFISIPLLDNRSVERRAGYEAHMRKVSGFIPLPPRS